MEQSAVGLRPVHACVLNGLVQVDYGKNTLGYERYCQQIKK
jgi:hypothetical protein